MIYAGSTDYIIWLNDHSFEKKGELNEKKNRKWRTQHDVRNWSQTQSESIKNYWDEKFCISYLRVKKDDHDHVLLNLLIRNVKSIDIYSYCLDARVHFVHFANSLTFHLTWKENLRQDQFHCDCFHYNVHNNRLFFSFILAIQLQCAEYDKLNDPQKHNQLHLFRSI